jgi:MFS family permease
MLRMRSPRAPAGPPALRLADAMEPVADPRGRPALVFHTAWGAAAGLTGSFSPLFMVESLRVGFVGVTLHVVTAALARTVAARLWGQVIDRAGVRPVLVVCSLGVAATSLLWVAVTPSTVWILAMDALACGTFDAGHALGTVALPLRVAPRGRLPFWLAAFATAGGLAFAAASMAGGVMVTAWGYGALFGAAALLRGIAALLATRLADPGAWTIREIVAEALRRALPSPEQAPE